MRNRSFSLVGLIAIIALLAASCGRAASEPQTLEGFLGWEDFDEQAAEEAWVETGRQIDEKVAECMAGTGLEYTPFPASEIPDFVAYVDEDLGAEGMTESEFKLRFGYGVFALVLEEHRFTVAHAQEIAQENPNETIHAQQADDADAYMAAWDECGDQATEAVRGPENHELGVALEEAWSPLEPVLEEKWKDLENDSRLIEAEEKWSVCMLEKGYDFDNEEELEDYLWAMGGEFDMPTGDRFTDETEAQLQALADEELAVAAADVACRGDFDKVYEELLAEYQGDFIAEHREQLEKIRQLEQQVMQRRLEGKE